MNRATGLFLRGAAALSLSALCLVAFAGSFVPMASMTTPRYLHSATLLANGTVLVVGGGCNTFGLPFYATAEIYNPATNSWSGAGSLAAGRCGHTATLLQSGRVLVAGGAGSSFFPIASVELYDPASNSWNSAASMANARLYHKATLLPNGTVLVSGGRVGIPGIVPTATTEIFDPASGSWSSGADMTVARNSHTATLLANNKVLVTGGEGQSGLSLASSELYDISQQRWDAGPSMVWTRSYHTATVLMNGQAMVAGGRVGSAETGASVGPAELYDPASNAWSGAGTLVVGRHRHSASRLPNGDVLLTGGQVGDAPSRPPEATAEIYDQLAGQWMYIGNMNSARASHTATTLPDGRIFLVGGYGRANDPSAWLATAEIFDPSANSSTASAPGVTSIGSAANATPTTVITLPVTCPTAGAVLLSGSGESTALSSHAGAAFIGLAYSIARDGAASDNSNVVQSSALAVFNGDANRDLINVQRVDSCTPGVTHTYRLTAYRTTADTSATSFVWNGRLTASEPLSGPGTGFAAGLTTIGSAVSATPTIISTLPVTCPASGAVLLSGSGESTTLSTNASIAPIGLAYSISRDSFASDNANVVQSSALAVFDGDANRDFLNVQRVDSCTPGVTNTYRLMAYRTTPDTSAGSFTWNARLTASAPSSLPGSGYAPGAMAIGSAANATPTIITTLPVTCPASGVVLVGGSGESTALSTHAGTAFIGLAYSIARDGFATDNGNVVQSSALATFNGDVNRDFLNVQRVDSCTPGTTSSYALTAYRTTVNTSPSSFVWNGRLVATFLP